MEWLEACRKLEAGAVSLTVLLAGTCMQQIQPPSGPTWQQQEAARTASLNTVSTWFATGPAGARGLGSGPRVQSMQVQAQVLGYLPADYEPWHPPPPLGVIRESTSAAAAGTPGGGLGSPPDHLMATLNLSGEAPMEQVSCRREGGACR